MYQQRVTFPNRELRGGIRGGKESNGKRLSEIAVSWPWDGHRAVGAFFIIL